MTVQLPILVINLLVGVLGKGWRLRKWQLLLQPCYWKDLSWLICLKGCWMLSVAFCAEYRNSGLQNILVSTGEARTCEISTLGIKWGEALNLILLPLITYFSLIRYHPVCVLTWVEIDTLLVSKAHLSRLEIHHHVVLRLHHWMSPLMRCEVRWLSESLMAAWVGADVRLLSCVGP